MGIMQEVRGRSFPDPLRKFSTRDDNWPTLVTMDLETFLKICDQFKLGDLVTEKPHPLTLGLAEKAQRDLHQAVEAFHAVDLQAINQLLAHLDPLPAFVQTVQRTLDRDGRIFLVGCGATGRLALSIETLAREDWLAEADQDRVVSFMAGGDAALIRSIESFEDYPEYGARQLRELGFTEKDLLIAITEGGETPFVIGACLEAATIASEPPWFLFCNPPETLKRVAERSRKILDHPGIRPFCLEIGPMALSGSTRLQATTIQMLVTGSVLMEAFLGLSARETIQAFHALLHAHTPDFLTFFIEAEANAYARGDHVLYETDRYGITVLTDTTERSPTFSLPPFENRHRPADPGSLCYLSIPGTPDSSAAWAHLLRRSLRTLEWPELGGRASMEYLLGHDISSQAPHWRSQRHPGKRQLPYRVHRCGPVLEFAELSHTLHLERQPLLLRHLMLKCCLNLQSTLVMGRLGRYESNIMSYVRPSNYKLIDRAARYRQEHHRQRTGEILPYEEAVKAVFRSIEP